MFHRQSSFSINTGLSILKDEPIGSKKKLKTLQQLENKFHLEKDAKKQLRQQEEVSQNKSILINALIELIKPETNETEEIKLETLKCLSSFNLVSVDSGLTLFENEAFMSAICDILKKGEIGSPIKGSAVALLKSIVLKGNSTISILVSKNQDLVSLLIQIIEQEGNGSNLKRDSIYILGSVVSSAANSDVAVEFFQNNKLIDAVIETVKMEKKGSEVKQEGLYLIRNIVAKARSAEVALDFYNKRKEFISSVIEMIKEEDKKSDVKKEAYFVLAKIAFYSGSEKIATELFERKDLINKALETIQKDEDGVEVKNEIIELFGNLAKISEKIANSYQQKECSWIFPIVIRNVKEDVSCRFLNSISRWESGRQYLLSNTNAVEALSTMVLKEGLFLPTLTFLNIVGKDEHQAAMIRANPAVLNLIPDALEALLHNQPLKNNNNTVYFVLDGAMVQALSNIAILKENRAQIGGRLVPLLHPALKRALAEENHRVARYLIQTMAHFSFDPEFLQMLRQDQELIHTMKNIEVKIETLNEWKELKVDLEGFLFTLTGQMEKLVELQKSTKTGQQQTYQNLMISYNWKYKEIAFGLQKFFKSRGYHVWIDVEEMAGNIMTAMADAVSKADAIIMLLSREYFDSANCQREAIFAVGDLKRKAIPIMVDSSYPSPGGWLAMLLAGVLRYSIYDSNQLSIEADKIEKNELLNRPNTRRSSVVSPRGSLMTLASQDATLNSKAPNQQQIPGSVDEVISWLKSINLEILESSFREEGIDGKALAQLAKLDVVEFRKLFEIEKKMTAVIAVNHIRDLFVDQ